MTKNVERTEQATSEDVLREVFVYSDFESKATVVSEILDAVDLDGDAEEFLLILAESATNAEAGQRLLELIRNYWTDGQEYFSTAYAIEADKRRTNCYMHRLTDQVLGDELERYVRRHQSAPTAELVKVSLYSWEVTTQFGVFGLEEAKRIIEGRFGTLTEMTATITKRDGTIVARFKRGTWQYLAAVEDAVSLADFYAAERKVLIWRQEKLRAQIAENEREGARLRAELESFRLAELNQLASEVRVLRNLTRTLTEGGEGS